MKDYELNKSKKGQFILNYQKKGNKIIVNYANGDSVVIDKTVKNIEILNNSMKEQVKNSNAYLVLTKKYIKLFICLGALGFVFSTPILLALIFSNIDFVLGTQILLGLGIGMSAGSLMLIVAGNRKIKDIEKNKKFIEIETKINEKVKENENMLYNTHRVTKNIVKNSEENEVVFTINSIDRVPFSDLEQIMENIEREEKFNFEYPEIEEETKKKELIK